ncbi:MAG TPA: phospholipase D-like domain-containing protein [Vicinamibacterales bacterium]|jgi:phosphatidylserine/phosphatidylglycerophosphate/cardiolipin synthase-like enzyme
MKLIIQPDDGVEPVLRAIRKARKYIDVLIFRLDRSDIARELQAAVERGVSVRALTAHTNRGGDKVLRKLEMQLLEGGVTVSRTADDLVRYHGKMMIVDNRVLHVYGFNFTSLDIQKSRSFGVITKNPRLVQEASKLFAADFDRQPYSPAYNRLVISPENARDRLAQFLRGARRELLIYDPGLTDDAMLRILTQKMRAGVDVKILGKVEGKWGLKCWDKYPGKRLHVRAIVRDGRRAFIGSQSLRKLELDKRREVGVIITDLKVVKKLRAVFEEDWAHSQAGKKAAKKAEKAEKAQKDKDREKSRADKPEKNEKKDLKELPAAS